MTEHSFYMERAIQLAKRGTGFTNPNPLVGAVIVKDHRIIGEGWHARYGDLHAERNALKHCTEDPAGATMYVTLEPCCHHGKQPPCTEALVESGIRRVYIGSRDFNPLVFGKGVQYLEEHGIEVIPDFLREACDKLNPIFFRYIGSKMPYTILKYAMTADGKIACAGGASKWVTGEAARAHVQQTRKRVAAICVGIGTVLADEFQLSKEELNGRHISLRNCLEQLGQRGLDSVLIEGGATIHAAALQENCCDLVQVYVAPKLFGGDGLSPIGGMGITTPDKAVLLSEPTITRLGQDLLLEYTRKEQF